MNDLPPWVEVQNGPARELASNTDAQISIGRHAVVEVPPSSVPAPESVLQQRLMLSTLQPTFLRYEERGDEIHHVYVGSIDEAQGLQFLCPVCFVANGGDVGTHPVVCWSRSRGVPNHATPGPGRWRITGTGLADVSLMEEPGYTRSVLLTSGCCWHGFVTDGVVT